MDSVFIFLCHTAGTALSLVIGFLFMKVLDCCLVRRHGKLVSLIGILGYGMVEESDKGYNQPAYDTATSQFTVQWTWCLRGLV